MRRATQQKSGDGKAYVDFYPRSPCGERHTPVKAYNIIKGFLSTLSLRRATSCTSIGRPKRLYFYPRSPCGERPVDANGERSITVFLSTLSLRRATWSWTITATSPANFYPRSPCGERRAKATQHIDAIRISIHALLAESDLFPAGGSVLGILFLSTLSLRRATGRDSGASAGPTISIHALLAESDAQKQPNILMP